MKKALIFAQNRPEDKYKKLLSSVRHLMFFSTPHQGVSGVGNNLLHVSNKLGNAADAGMIAELELWSKPLNEENTYFVGLADTFTITSFYETEKTYNTKVRLAFYLCMTI